MTADKYQHNCPLKAHVKSLEDNVCGIKDMVTGMYNRFSDLVDTTEAIYKTVTYHPDEPHCTPDDNWDFLDEEE